MSSKVPINITRNNIHPLLKKYIRKISIFKCKGAFSYRQKLTPTAFMYLTYHHEDIPPNIIGNETINPNFRLQIDGPKIYKDGYIEYNGKLNRILVEFTATGFYYLFHSSPADCIDKLFKLENFVPIEAVHNLEHELQALNNSEEQVNIIQEFLLELFYKALPFCDYIENALGIINNQCGRITVNDIIEKLRISKRQLNRQFNKIVGISPKRYSKILQLHYIINTMGLKKYSSLQEIAYNSDFYDLSHFSHVFKELTGFSPIEFINSDKHIALKYFNDLI